MWLISASFDDCVFYAANSGRQWDGYYHIWRPLLGEKYIPKKEALRCCLVFLLCALLWLFREGYFSYFFHGGLYRDSSSKLPSRCIFKLKYPLASFTFLSKRLIIMIRIHIEAVFRSHYVTENRTYWLNDYYIYGMRYVTSSRDKLK